MVLRTDGTCGVACVVGGVLVVVGHLDGQFCPLSLGTLIRFGFACVFQMVMSDTV